MALDDRSCEAYFKGEVRPIIFEVYTESGMPFELIQDPSKEPDDFAYCEVTTAEGTLVSTLGVTMIEEEPARKKMLCSWDTGQFELGYYNLQVWVTINVSGSTDPSSGKKVVEAKLASELITRYIKEA